MIKFATTDVCLLTPGQPSNNPRVVKEADALTEAGYTVQVLCVDCGLWPSRTDSSVLAVRPWACSYAGGTVSGRPWRYRYTRLRHAGSKRMLPWLPKSEILRRAAMVRAGPELETAALRHPAKLYIAHHVAALPAAVKAAAGFGASVGYDAEDFYTGMHRLGQPPPLSARIAGEIERTYLKYCNYVTAASPGIADAYTRTYRIPPPVPVLNVFPLAQRPSEFRTGNALGALRLYWFSQCIGCDRGLEDVVRAIGLLGDANIELHLRGNWQAGYRERLLAIAHSAGANTDRVFSHAPAAPDEMVRLSAEYDLGLDVEQPVVDNKQICLSNKLFVYLLAGNAIIATNVAGQRSLVAELGQAGSSYTPGDIQGLGDRIRTQYRNRNSLEASRREAWRWGELRYNWDREKQTFLRVVEGVLRNRAGGLRAGAVVA